MKRKLTLALLAILLTSTLSFLHAQTVYRSVVTTGNWGSNTSWEISTDGGVTFNATTTSGQTPGATSDVIIRNGHTISLDASGKNAKNVTIQSGGTLKSVVATEKTLRVNGATFQNDGTLGGVNDQITLELNIANAVGGFTVTGGGAALVNRIRMVGGNTNPSTVTIDQNVTAQVGSNGLASSYGLAASATPNNADNYTYTINAGKTYTITGGAWHNSGASAGAAANIGNYTYNINGTLDMAASVTTTNSSFFGSTDATKTLTANINGTVKLPTSGTSSLDMSESSATGQQGAVVFNINNGGLLDANIAPINTTTTTLPTRYFRLSGTGQLRRTVGGGTDVLFAVGTPTTYNPVTINNTGTSDNFSVNVKNTFDETPPSSKRVDRQWIINEGTAGGTSATLKFAWTTADQTAGFTTASPVYIYHYNGSVWDATLATVTGSGTTADPYVATASGFTSFSPFAIGNDVTLPVSFINNKAFTQANGVQVQWTTAFESGISNFVIERSADGRNFSNVGSVAINPDNNYSWFDATPFSGVNYYRIKSTELSGGTKYTSIMKVTIGKKGAEMIIASNPVKGGLLNLQLSGMEKGNYTLLLLTTSGQQVFSKGINIEGSSLSQGVQLPRLSSGVYAVQLRSNGINLTKNIVVE